MSAPSLAEVHPARITAMDLAHGPSQSLGRMRYRDQMDMVGHQAVRPDLDLVGAAPLRHEFDVILVIFVRKKVCCRRLPRWVI